MSSTSAGGTTLPSCSSTSASSSSASAGGVPAAVVAAGRDTSTVGPISALREYAAHLERTAEDAAAVARAATNDAAQS